MSARIEHHSKVYRFLIAIFLPALLEASFQLLDSKVKGTVILEAFSMEHILQWGKQPETGVRGIRYNVFQFVGLNLPVPEL